MHTCIVEVDLEGAYKVSIFINNKKIKIKLIENKNNVKTEIMHY